MIAALIRPLKPLLSHALMGGLGALIVALPAVFPLLVVLVAYLLTAVLTVAALCCVAALIVLTWAWTRYRVGGWQTDLRLEAATAQFASEMVNVMPATVNDVHAWRVAYEQFAYIAFAKGSMSFGAMKPYIAANKQPHWTHMKDQLLAAGWASEDGGRTCFIGSYKRFGHLLRSHQLELLPHPKLPAPTILPWIRHPNMQLIDITAQYADMPH